MTPRSNETSTIRFVLKFALTALGVILALRAVGLLVAYSRWTGILAVGVIFLALFVTAPRWIKWLPGLLVFGIINSLIGLVTRHAPITLTHLLSPGVAALTTAVLQCRLCGRILL